MSHSKFLRINKVTDASGLSRSSVYRLARLGHFPKPVKIGLSAVGWLSEEIDQWIAERKHSARAGVPV